MSKRRLVYGLAAVSSLCCSSRSAAPVSPVSGASNDGTHQVSERTFDTGWGSGTKWVVSERLGLRLPLPVGSEWQTADPGYGWFVTRHEPTHSELRVRVWREDKLVRAVDCGKRLSSWQPIFAELRLNDILSEERQLEIAGFQSQLIVAVNQNATTGVSHGLVVAFGSKLQSCWAAVFGTDAGLDERRVVESRVEWISDAVIRRVQAHDIEQRVRRERSPE